MPPERPEHGGATMLRWVYEFPGQMRRALERASAVGWPETAGPSWRPAARPPRAAALFGMGGSGMAAELAFALAGPRLLAPALVLHRPEVPAWLAEEDLAGVLTYSGGTWEAEAALIACLARKVPAFAVTSDATRLRAAGLPAEAAFVLEAGMAPRAALGILLVPTLLALAPLVSGGGPWIRSELEAAIAALEEEVALWKTGRALPGRDPAALAAEVAGKPAVIYAPDETFHPAAVRWKNQILENGKQAAFEASFPELAHNEIMGWEFAAARLDPVYLLLEAEPEGAASGAAGSGAAGSAAAASAPGAAMAAPGPVLRRGAIAELERAGARCLRVPAFGANTAARLLSHILLADRTSLELASQRGVDPLPVEAITRVKQARRKEGHA